MSDHLWFSMGWPPGLWALLICPLLLLAVYRSRALLSRPMFAVVTVARILVVILVVLALADARAHWPNDEVAVATVVDSSASVSAEERNAIVGRLRWLKQHRSEVEWIDVSNDPISADSSTPDLDQRVAAAVALLPRDRARRIVLATDGREASRSRLFPAIREAAAAGVTVHTLAMGDLPHVDQVAVTGIDVPRLIRAGESANLQIQLTSTTSLEVSLKIELDGQNVQTSNIAVQAGRTTHSHQLTFEEEGVHELAVSAVSEGDTLGLNNHWRSLVRIAPPPRVLLVRQDETTPAPLAKVLSDARLQVEVLSPSKVAQSSKALNRYQLVVLDETSPDMLAEPQRQAVRGWVEDGGGLVTITGVNAVRRQPTTIREIEPIVPPRDIPETPPMEVILVIDRSGSMSGHRMAMARQAGVAAVQALRPDSRVGLVAFSGSPDTVIPPRDMSHAQYMIAMISSLTSGGGTDIAAALNAAGSIMTNDPRYLHHIILLSDGVSSRQQAYAEAQALAYRGITISTISLGRRNSLMSDIAAVGRGRYHVAHDPRSLPRLFVRETRFRQAPPHREGNFLPEVAENMAFLDGVDFTADPPMSGYVLAETRPQAQTVLRSPDGDPVLAYWEVGSGSVASFTSATSSRWSDGWRTGQSFQRLWSQLAWEMLRERAEVDLEMRVDAHPADSNMQVVTVATLELEPDDPPTVVLARSRSQEKPLVLIERGPGLWQAEVETNDGFIASGHLPESDEPAAAVAVDNPYPAELRAFGADTTLLAALADAGNGHLLDSMEMVLGPAGDVPTTRALRLPFLITALLLYLLSVLLLRLPRNAKGGRKGAPAKSRVARPKEEQDVEKRQAA